MTRQASAPAETAGAATVPTGFEPMPPFGPFHELTGPIYVKKTEAGYAIGLLVEEKHRNKGQMVHGGMISMLADTACTWASKYSREPAVKVVTSHLSVGFTGNALPGDWLEARVEVVKSGRRVVFSNCFIWSKGKCIAHATAQFQVVGEESA